MRRTSTSLAACSVLSVALLAGCGGSSKPATTTTTTAATTTSAATTVATTTAAAATSPALTTSAAATTPTGSPSGLSGLASLSKCPQLASLYGAAVAALTGTGNDVGKEVQILQQYAAKTPTAIRADFETLAAAFAKIAAATKGLNSSGGGVSSSALSKLEALGPQLNTPALSHAEQAIDQWATTNCHA